MPKEIDPIAILNTALMRYSQADIAKEIECSRQYINNVLKGRSPPSQRLLHFLGLRKRPGYEFTEKSA